ncbi:MAG: holo-ACP synthase [Campylobacter sp.]|nr:holo-ACP synthase [Campylobacter sp.]
MIGIDIVKIERISKIRAKFGAKFMNKFLNQNEQFLIKSDASLAGFFAAKEAFSKAIGVGIGSEFGFRDIEIYKDQKGAPKLNISQRLKEKFAITKADLSISHDGGFAIAAVIIS